MDDLQLHMDTAQRIHDENVREFNEFMHRATENHRHHSKHQHEVSEARMAELEKEFQEWMEYIRSKKL